jgi:hypothetical protein
VTVEHPLQQTLARARLLNPYICGELGAPAGADWLSAPVDLAPGAARLEQLAGEARAQMRTGAPAVIGSVLLQGYQWPLLCAAIACFLLDRRVPALEPAATRLHYGPARRADALALGAGRFTALPGDPAADHPDARVVADLAALRAALRGAIEGHLAPLIDRLCDALGCHPRGLWLSAADACAGTLVWLMQAEGWPGGQPADIEAEVAALVRAPGSPLHTRQIGLVLVGDQGQRRVFLRRAACCQWYRVEGGHHCNTCTRLSAAERTARQLLFVAQERARRGARKEAAE